MSPLLFVLSLYNTLLRMSAHFNVTLHICIPMCTPPSVMPRVEWLPYQSNSFLLFVNWNGSRHNFVEWNDSVPPLQLALL